MIEAAVESAVALQAGMPHEVRMLPSFMREKASVLRMTAEEGKTSIVESWKKYRSSQAAKGEYAKDARKKGLAGVGVTAYTLFDDAVLFPAYNGIHSALPETIPTTGKELGLVSAFALASNALARVVTKYGRSNNVRMPNARPAEGTAAHDSLVQAESELPSEPLTRRIGHQALSLGRSLYEGVPANDAIYGLTDRQVKVHSRVYGATAAGLYWGAQRLGLLENMPLFITAVSAQVGSRYVHHVFDQGAERAGSTSLAEAVTLPAQESIHVPLGQQGTIAS